MTPKKLAVTAIVVALFGIGLGVVASQTGGSDPELQVVDGPFSTPGEASAQTRTIVRTVPGSQGGSATPQQPQPQQPQPEAPEATDIPEDPDDDDDGVEDVADNCPSTPNADQSDFDGDGKGDLCDADDDNDNLSDAAEGGYGTNPYKKDTDGDGWYDGNEVNWGTDPLDPSDYPEFKFPTDVTKF